MIEFKRYGSGKHKIVGLHGWFGDESSFLPLEMSLNPRDFDCAWLAHRGYGRSMAIAGRFNMEEMAQDSIAVADRLGWTTFSVIGHSMGGKAAQLIAAHAPERVDKLICAAPVSADPVPLDPQMRQMFVAATTEPDCRRAIISFSTGDRLNATWIDGLVAKSFARSAAEAFASYFKSWADDDFSNLIGRRDVKTLVLVGAEDPVITAKVCEQGFRHRYASLTIKTLQNSGHYPIDEVPLAFGAEVAKFLKPMSSATQ